MSSIVLELRSDTDVDPYGAECTGACVQPVREPLDCDGHHESVGHGHGKEIFGLTVGVKQS